MYSKVESIIGYVCNSIWIEIPKINPFYFDENKKDPIIGFGIVKT